MEKLNFKELNKLMSSLKDLNKRSTNIFLDQLRQEAAVRAACESYLEKCAGDALKDVSVEELKNSKAGIRVSALQEAGYTNLGELAGLQDWELKSIDGIGEKQVESIRNIIQEFLSHLTEYMSIKLSVEDDSPENRELLKTLAAYRQGQQLREDVVKVQDEFRSQVTDISSRMKIKNNVHWFFSNKSAKESTLQALGDLLVFFKSPICLRMNEILEAYENTKRIDMSAAVEDFKQNGAEYYALVEKLGGMKLSKPLIYSSIPAMLADEIDEMELNLQSFHGNLRSYQAFGAKYILHQGRVLLGDEMGMGKTIQAIAAMADIHARDNGSFFLVVCPASVLINWCREIGKFSAIEAHLVHGPFLEEAFAKWQEVGGAAVTNFETMPKIVGRIDNHMHLSMLVIDEAHYIKNPDALRTQNIRKLDNESERILMMTGTPLENRVDEMCSLIDFVRPDMTEEVRRSAYMSQVPQFRQLLAPVYLRRQREQVLEELPPIEEKQEWCAMTDADRNAYIECLEQKSFVCMRRVSFLQEDMTRSAKAIRLLELCEEAGAEDRKVLIYSFFRETVAKVSELLKDVCVGTISGDTPIDTRQALIDRFTKAPGGSVLVCQVQAGGTGLNIQTASIVIFCEPQIKPSLTNQAISRVYRMGQVRNVLVYHLLCEDTVDEAMVRLLEEKQAEFDAYADESAMGDMAENLMDREWIGKLIEEQNRKYQMDVR